MRISAFDFVRTLSGIQADAPSEFICYRDAAFLKYSQNIKKDECRIKGIESYPDSFQFMRRVTSWADVLNAFEFIKYTADTHSIKEMSIDMDLFDYYQEIIQSVMKESNKELIMKIMTAVNKSNRV